MRALSLTALPDIDEIRPGDDLAAILASALTKIIAHLQSHDVLVVAQKIVSKAEDRYVDLDAVQVTPRAVELGALTGKDPRLVELILGESVEVLRAKADVLIVRHRLGFVMANAGVDRSNVVGANRVLLLPQDPDGSAARLRSALAAHVGTEIGVVISDSCGRAWRRGVTNVALGASGLPALVDRRGERDRNGRKLQITEVAFADQLASAAGLVMGEGAEGYPAVLVSGLCWKAASVPASTLIRPLQDDLFR